MATRHSNPNNRAKLANMVKSMRKNAGLLQRELGTQLWPDQQWNPNGAAANLVRYEKGRKTPGIDMIVDIAEVCGYKISITATPVDHNDSKVIKVDF